MDETVIFYFIFRYVINLSNETISSDAIDKQLCLGLAVNVYKNGQWGTLRFQHLYPGNDILIFKLYIYIWILILYIFIYHTLFGMQIIIFNANQANSL